MSERLEMITPQTLRLHAQVLDQVDRDDTVRLLERAADAWENEVPDRVLEMSDPGLVEDLAAQVAHWKKIAEDLRHDIAGLLDKLSPTDPRGCIETAVHALEPLAGDGKASVRVAFCALAGQDVPAWDAIQAQERAVRYDYPDKPSDVIISKSEERRGVMIEAQYSRAPLPSDIGEGDETEHRIAFTTRGVE